METSIISVKNIVKTYQLGDLKVPALNGISFEITAGEFIIIKGRNGSGKSTLLRQLGLLDRPDSGEIFLSGQEVTQLKEKKRTQMRLNMIGYIFQEYALLAELTVLENIMLPAMMLSSLADCRARALQLVRKIGLAEKQSNLISQLSGGEKQKVAIARALVNDPAVIFADEPTANLDSAAAKGVLELLKKINQEEGHTIVMVTHEPEEEIYARRIIELRDGRIK